MLMKDLNKVRSEIAMNFDMAFLAVRYAAPLIRPGGGIVCLSSDAVTQAGWGISVYGAAKLAAAFELGGASIRVNAVRPGLPCHRNGKWIRISLPLLKRTRARRR